MRVLLVSARADHGGGPQNVFQHAEVLSRDHEIFIACPREEPYWSRFEGVVGAGRMVEIPHRAFRPAAVRMLSAFIRKHEIAIVHSHGFGAGLYGRLCALFSGARSIHTPHGITPASDLSGWIKMVIDWLLSAITARVIAVSVGEAAQIRRRTLGAGRVVVVLNGVKLAATPLPVTIFDERPRRVAHVTRFVFQKNPELFIAVLEELRRLGAIEGFRFVVLGDGPDRPPIEAQIAARGLAPYVEFLGAIDKVMEQYARSFCLLSTSRWEGMPIALLEAAGVGSPTVATDVVGNRDAVSDGKTGFLFHLDAPADAARRLVELSRSKELWTSLSRGAFERAHADFSEERMAGETLEVYRSAIGASAGASR